MADDAEGEGRIAPDWIGWARVIQAVAQNGLHYTESHFDRERYEKLMALALEIFSAHTGEDRATLERWLGAQGGYVTPKVDVRAACFRDGRILLVRERSDGLWGLFQDRTVHRLSFKGGIVIFIVFALGDILFGGRAELWEHGTFMVLCLVTYDMWYRTDKFIGAREHQADAADPHPERPMTELGS